MPTEPDDPAQTAAEPKPGAGPAVPADSPKPHGDTASTVDATALDVSPDARPGDSPKPHGDALARAVHEVVKP